MLITSQQVKDYTVIKKVKDRLDALLDQDIIEAQMEMFAIVHHDFSDAVKYPTIPEEVQLACKKLTQYYALYNSDDSGMQRIKSEKIGDYTYQKDGLEKPDVYMLLKPHVQEKPPINPIHMKVRLL